MTKRIFRFLFLLSFILLPLRGYSSELTDDYIDMASEWANSGNYAKALEYINTASQIEPSNKKLLSIKQILNQVMHPENYPANRSFSSLNASVENYLDEGIKNYEAKNYNVAMESFQKYLTYNPKSDFAYTMLAKCYLDANNPTLALNYIEKARNLSDSVENKMLQAKILYAKGYYVQAKNIFEALKVTVQTSELYEYIGLCDYRLNNYAQALNNIDKAIILRDDVQHLNLLYNEIKSKLEVEN